jgi:SAM-dependent methyltransferase
MFDDHVKFAGVELEVDPIDRERTENSDNAMAIFYEEQPFMWEFVKDEIRSTIESVDGSIDFLDVGTGSGIWSLLVAENTSADNVVAIDKSKRAIKKARGNRDRNDAGFEVREEFYNTFSAPHRSSKVIGLYPPYHLYPQEISEDIPQHARGGVTGQQIFKEQLVIMNYHLADDGIIVFNQMCLGSDEPAYIDYIPELVEGASVHYTNIFPPMKTAEFLSEVYEDQFAEWQKSVSELYPQVFYTTGWIRRDGKEEIREIDHSINLHGRSWDDRIKLHHEIGKHGL